MIYCCPSCKKLVDTDHAVGYIMVTKVEKGKPDKVYVFCYARCLEIGMSGKVKVKTAGPMPKPKPSPRPRPNKENIKLVLRKKQ